MKFYLSLAIAAILVTSQANAQHLNIGIKGGLNLYGIHNDNGDNYDTKAGFHLGLLGHIHLNKHVAFQQELVYSLQGAKYNIDNAETKINLGYINVPLLLQYMFDNGFRLQAGPQVGFLIASKAKTDNTSTKINDTFNPVDLGLVLGVGYVSSSGFGIDARYNLGLTNMNENSSVKSTNRGVQLGVFYLFHNR